MTVYVCEKPKKRGGKYNVKRYNDIEGVQEINESYYLMPPNDAQPIIFNKGKFKIKCYGF